jgi:hypothetical protein
MSANPSPPTFLIGRDLGPAGRLVRILAGLLNLAAAVGIARLMGPITVWSLGQVLVALIGTALAYTIAIGALGPRVLGRIDPWLAAIAVVLPLAVLFALPFVPDPVLAGAFLYIAISQLIQAVIGYGGCEIVGIPTLVLRRRYTIYCVLNAADVVERWLERRPRWVAWTLALAAFAVTAALGGMAQLIGKAVGFFAAYLAFLVVGFVVGRILASASRPSAEVG